MNLYLTGFRGSGKTTVAPLIADSLGREFVDSDHEIERLTRRSIEQIFHDDGESGFRRWESQVVETLSRTDQLVVSLGGGVPTVAENREAMGRSGRSVWLLASPEVLWQRISSDPRSPHQRPGLTKRDGIAEVVFLLQQRETAYRACADYRVDTTELNPQQIADLIVQWWQSVDR